MNLMIRPLKGLVGIIAAMTIAGCMGPTRLEPNEANNYDNSQVTAQQTITSDQPYEEEKPKQVSNKKEELFVKPKEVVEPKPPVFSRSDVFPTKEEFKSRKSLGLVGLFVSEDPETDKLRRNFYDKLKRIREYPEQAMDALSLEDKQEFEDLFSGNLDIPDSYINIGNVFPGFDKEETFKKKIHDYGITSLDNLSELDKVKIFLDEKLRGFFNPADKLALEEYSSSLYSGHVYFMMRGKDRKGNEIEFPASIGGFNFFISFKNLESYAYNLFADMSESEAVERLEAKAINDGVCFRENVDYISGDETVYLFYSKESETYKKAQDIVRKIMKKPETLSYLKHIAENRFKDKPDQNMIVEAYIGILEEVIIDPARAGAEAAAEAVRHPIKTRIKMRRR